MNKYLLTVVAVVATAVLAFAVSHTNFLSDPAPQANSTLTITPQDEASLTIPTGATVVICNSEGTPLEPQPYFTISPNKGTSATSQVIKKTIGSFNAGTTVKISQIDTNTSSTAALNSAWSNS